jgi:hypothetical protein
MGSRILQNITSSNSTISQAIYVFNVCPIQDVVCGSDTVGSAKTYNEYVSDFAASLNNATAFASVIGKSGIPIIGTPIVIRDLGIPVLNFTANAPVFTINSVDNTGWNLTFYNPNQVRCWWSLSSINAPSDFQIRYGCIAGLSSCGVTTVSSSGAVISNTTSNPLNWNTNYVIWAYCSNNITNSANYANVTQIFSFTTSNNPSSLVNNNTNNTTNNTTNNSTSNTTNNTSTNKSSGSYINLGIGLFMSIVFLFNL